MGALATASDPRPADGSGFPDGGGAAISTQGLRVEFGDRVAVEDLTISVPRGEVLGVLGPNGAGKTTAIRVLTTVLQPTRGTFSVAGVGDDRSREIRRRIGVLPESAGYPDHQTALEFLRYHGRLHGASSGEARAVAERLLREFGLDDRARSLIGGFSRGMRQRLGIARALVNDPEVVFLDEPTLGLDPGGQLQILDHIRSIARERGATVLLSTHLLAEVEEVCSRVLILDRGRVRAEGTVAEVTALVAASRRLRLRVGSDALGAADTALCGRPEVGTIEHDALRPGGLLVTLTGDPARGGAAVLSALDAAGIHVRSFEMERASLSDAFFAVTGGEG
ncbi:MAG: ABC transporter ATP-binding protein [Thermoleophilia bacterium]